jgi:hypothetical protein
MNVIVAAHSWYQSQAPSSGDCPKLTTACVVLQGLVEAKQTQPLICGRKSMLGCNEAVRLERSCAVHLLPVERFKSILPVLAIVHHSRFCKSRHSTEPQFPGRSQRFCCCLVLQGTSILPAAVNTKRFPLQVIWAVYSRGSCWASCCSSSRSSSGCTATRQWGPPCRTCTWSRPKCASTRPTSTSSR